MSLRNLSPRSVDLANKVEDTRVWMYLAKEKSVREWINKVLKVKLDNDLVTALSNGIVVCYLMREIDRYSIPKIQENQKAMYTLKENVRFFIDALAEYGVPRWKLFFVNDLWDGKNIVKVVDCLSWFGKKVTEDGFRVPYVEGKDDPNERATLTKKEILKIKSMLTKINDEEKKGQRRPVSSGLVKRKMQYLLSGSGVDFETLEGRLCKLQGLVRGHLQRKRYRKLLRHQYTRNRVVEEILHTEDTYLKGLSDCIEHFYNPLRDTLSDKRPILNKNQFRCIFSDLEIIFNLNTAFRKKIKRRVSKWSNTRCIGDIFLESVKTFKIYTNYVQNFNTSLTTLDNLMTMKNSRFKPFYDEAIQKLQLNDLQGYLIMPVQRIPRYSLLLRDLGKHTWAGHPDEENIKNAGVAIDEISTYLNERARQFENTKLLLQLSRDIYNCDVELVVPTRRYITKASFQNKLTVYLFNDLFLVGKSDNKKKPNLVKCRQTFKLENLDLKTENKPKLEFYVSVVKVLTVVISEDTPADFESEFLKAKEALKQPEKKVAVAEVAVEEEITYTPEERLRMREKERGRLRALLENERATIQCDDTPRKSRLISLLTMKNILKQQLDTDTEASEPIAKEAIHKELQSVESEINLAKKDLSATDVDAIEAKLKAEEPAAAKPKNSRHDIDLGGMDIKNANYNKAKSSWKFKFGKKGANKSKKKLGKGKVRKSLEVKSAAQAETNSDASGQREERSGVSNDDSIDSGAPEAGVKAEPRPSVTLVDTPKKEGRTSIEKKERKKNRLSLKRKNKRTITENNSSSETSVTPEKRKRRMSMKAKARVSQQKTEERPRLMRKVSSLTDVRKLNEGKK